MAVVEPVVIDRAGRHVRRLTAGFTAVTVVAAWLALLVPGPVIGTWWVLASVTVGFFAAEVATTHVRHGTESESFSISEVPLAVGLLVLGPIGVIAARLVGSSLALVLDRRQRGAKLWFNLAMWSAQAAAASAIVAGHDPTSATGALVLLLAVALTDAMAAVAINSIISKVSGRRTTARRLADSIRGGLPPALAAAAFAFVLVHTVTGHLVLAGPLALIGMSILLAFRAEMGLLTEQDGLRRVATLGTVVLNPDLDEDASVRQLLAVVAEVLSAHVAALEVTEPGGDRRVFTLDGRATPLLEDLADPTEPRLLTPEECRGRVRDGLLVPLPQEAPVNGRLLVADSTGQSAVLGAADLRVAVSLAGQLATIVHNTRLHGTVRAQAKQARWEARHDPLTSLPNRFWLDENLRAQPAGRSFSVLLLDLDGFKAVNDALGHTSGDDLLVEFSRRLRTTVPDDVTVTRFAGDEFVCLVPGQLERGEAVASAVHAHFQTASNVRGVLLSVSPSIGVAHHPTDGTDSEELLRQADVAMFRAKREHLGVARFIPEDADKAARQLRLGGDLRQAIRDERLTCAYQPIIDLHTGAVSHFEVLARWQHPDLGPVAPDEFIHLAETSGLIRDLTIHMVRQAARGCRRWLANGIDAGVAVNLSSQSLADTSLPDAIRQVLTAEGLQPRRLSVEITETTLLTDAGRALPMLAEFEAAGIGVAMDDFGTGYSSLAYLGRIPLDVLKVDRSLVQNRADARGATILRAVIDLASALGLPVVAEGIEDADTYMWLRDNGCAFGQGYFMAKPMAEEHLADWWASWMRTRRELCATPGRRLSVPAAS